MKAFEANFDGLVGPSHCYGGLSVGNVASIKNAANVASPKEAAKQGLAKMKALHDMGFVQGVLPPQERPALHVLRQLGFTGSDTEIVTKAAKEAPELLTAMCSASSMWTANAGTVSPSADTTDGKLHFTVANLNNKLHRSIEHPTTFNTLRATFGNTDFFNVHPALPAQSAFGDEGAANHTRFCAEYGKPGVEFFVYGMKAFDRDAPRPQKFPARQTLEAFQAIARNHGLPEERCVFAQQNPEVIDAGVFHNDVISVGNGNVIFYHEKAFLNTDEVLAEIDSKLEGADLVPVMVPDSEVSVEDAVHSYLFNSQLLRKDNGDMMLIIPEECKENPRVWAYLEKLIGEGNSPIKELKIFDLRQSMRNGGGPACLRLRVVLTEAELKAVNQKSLMSDEQFTKLNAWVDKHYRDEMHGSDLADPKLVIEVRDALDELTQILDLGSIYPFQLA